MCSEYYSSRQEGANLQGNVGPCSCIRWQLCRQTKLLSRTWASVIRLTVSWAQMWLHGTSLRPLSHSQISGSPNSTSHSCSSWFLVYPISGWFYLPSRINNREHSWPPCIFFPWPKLLLCLLTSSQILAIFVKYLSKAIMVFGLLLEWVKYWRGWRQDLTSQPSNPRLPDVHSYCSTTPVNSSQRSPTYSPPPHPPFTYFWAR